MRIALITPGFSADEGDWCIPALLNMVRELARENQVHVFTLRYPHRRGKYQLYQSTVHAFGAGASAGVSRLPLMAQAMRAIVAEHRRRPFDLLHGFWADEPGFLAVTGGRLLSIPSVVSLMGGELVGWPEIGYGGQLSYANRWLARMALRRADCVTAGSIYLRRLAQDYVRAERLKLWPLGVDIGMFSTEFEGQGAFMEGDIKLLHVGSLAPVKDQATLLRAFSTVSAHLPGAHLHIAGDGPLLGELENLAEWLGIGDKVTFHGPVSHQNLPAYYRAADVCVSSSRYESQGMVVLEAAACGCALVGTAVGLLPEIAPAAQITPVGDATALAEAILGMMADDVRRAEIGRATQNLVERSYSLQHSVHTLSGLYAGLVGRNLNSGISRS